MALRLYDATIESKVLKIICNAKSDTQSKLLGRLHINYFGTDQAKEVFARVSNLIQSGKQIPTTDVLKHDQVLSDGSREFISGKADFKDQDVEASIDILEKYRKIRLVYNMAAETIEEMKSDSPNIDNVLGNLESTLLEARVNTDANEIIRIGKNGNADDLVHEILRNERLDLIPTGFKEFDTKVGGFAKKNVIFYASTSGGGKSLLMQQTSMNQYRMGFNVGVVSFEMEKLELMARILANLGYIPHEYVHLRKISMQQRKKIIMAWDEFSSRGEQKGNTLDIYCPTRDMTIQDVFIEMKPRGYDIIYIDYVGLLKQDDKKALWESLGNIARAAKLGANALNVAVVIAAQLDEDTLKLKYSKALKHNAHYVWTWTYDEKAQELGIIQINQIKARSAKPFPFYLTAEFDKMTISDYDGPPPEQSAVVNKKNVPTMSDLT